MTDAERMTSTESDSTHTPAESDEALEPIDVVRIDDERLLFYLAGRVPIPIQDLAEDTKQSPNSLRQYFYEELELEVDIDSTDFANLVDPARAPVLRAAKPYIRSGQGHFDAGRSAFEQELFQAAITHFERGIQTFEEIRSRFEAVNYSSEELNQQIEIMRDSIEEARESLGESADQVEALLGDTPSDANTGDESESAVSGSAHTAREAMIKIVRDLHTQLERVPKTTELPEECEYSPNDFYQEFGSWDEALEAAGIDREQALLDDIEQVAEQLGRVPKATDIDKHGTYSGSNYSTYFGSWSTALEQANLEEEDREEELLETLQDLHDRLDRLPKPSDLHKTSGISQHDYVQTFGSWDEGLEAAGINKEQYLIKDLKQVAAEVGGKPSTTAVNQFGEFSAGMHQRYFDSWDAALKTAGLSSLKDGLKSNQGQTKSGRATTTPSTQIEAILVHVDNVGPESIAELKSSGFTTLDDLRGVEPREIARHRGIGRTKANELIRFISENVSKSQVESSNPSSTENSASPSSEGTTRNSHPADDGTTLDLTTSIEEIVAHIDGVGQSNIHAVKKAGYTTLGELRDARPADIATYEGIDWKKTQKLIRFAKEKGASSGHSSPSSAKDDLDSAQSSASTSEVSTDRLEPSALKSSWETISESGRIDGQFLLQVTAVDRQVGDRKTAQLNIQDQNGRAFRMNVWAKHDTEQEWNDGEWYALENAIAKVWESSDGTTRKKLSSTDDLEIVELGEDFDPSTASVRTASDTTSERQQTGAIDDEDISGSTSGSTTAGDDTTDDGSSADDDKAEIDDNEVLDEIISEFDGI